MIIEKLGPKLAGLSQQEKLTFVTYQMWGLVRDLLYSEVADVDDLWDWTSEVAIVGGIMINRDVGGDFFQPMSFETFSKEGRVAVDLYADAFGPRPDLAPILGADEAEKLKRPTAPAFMRKG